MRNSYFKRILAAILVLALIVAPVAGSFLTLTASAATQSPFDRVSDHESIDYWKGYFSDGQYDSNVWSNTISTQNAGAVWTDKSVFVPNSTITIDGVNVPVADTGDNFLISMSVMASNKTVRGYEYIPTSTMLVLDVSGSMGNSNSGTWDEMVEAANKAIDTLLNLNQNNLVGVVLYSGNTQNGDSDIDHSTVILPLDRYTTTATNNNGTNNRNDDYPEYLTASNASVSVNNAVRPSRSGRKSIGGGTYIQGGIYRAMEELIAEDAPKVVAEGVQAGVAYMPIVVLMSDGAPTAANLDYDFNGDDSDHETDIGNGTATDERMGFLTQLTAAYAKARIDGAYEKDTLFYTLGLGLNSLSDNDESVAEAVLNPAASSGNIRTYWNTYLALDNDRNTPARDTMYLNNNNQNAVSKSDYVTEDYRNYVTQYFAAEASQGETLEQALLNAFQQIVDMIVLQSVYYPTEIGGSSADLGGYVTFRDELGEYMDVRSVKGFLFEDENGNQVLHTGAALAQNFVTGGGDLGQSTNPKPLGDELVRSVKARLGIEDTLTAQDLIRNAYYYGQLSYVDENNFSNYIGWYGDADGKFVDFWHDGHTQAEEQAAIAKGAKFIYKSYGYLGEVNEDLGIKASDMMYTSIRVRETIAEGAEGTAVGEIVVEGSIPASLIPTITYEVALNGKTYESGVNTLSITGTSAQFPARILYEVGLRSDINPINITEKVNDRHKNQDGTYTFYTNDWAFVDYENNAIADTSINAFTHFEPSSENERYYYLTDSVVYRDAQGTPYTGTTKPSGDGYYHQYRVFSVTNGRATSEITYIKTSPDALAHAVSSGSNWVIPAGTGKHEIVGYKSTLKEHNNTETNRFTAYPKIKTDAEGASGEHSAHYSVVTFGNNGKLTVTPATGIKLTKALDIASATAQTFEFKIAGATAGESYIVTPVDAEGNFGTAATVTANASGVITVNVEAGTSVYVTGLNPGTYTVTESEHSAYRVLTINGASAATNQATVTVVSQQTSEIRFVNTLKGYGSLYITKEVVNSLAGQALPEHATNAEFDVTVDVGQALATKEFAAAHSADATLTKVTVDADGKITGLKIKHGQTIVIRDLPENTTAVVTETLSAAQSANYTASYSSHNKAGETMDNDGMVTIEKNANATVVVNNTYKPVETDVTIGFGGTKSMDATNLQENKSFEFVLEQYANGSWTPVSGWNATAEITAHTNHTGANAVVINFHNFQLNLNFTEPGVQSYRIFEKEPNAADGIAYDPAIFTFVVTVTDNNGQLTAAVTGSSITGSGNAYTANVSFTNAYHTEPVIIDVQKIVDDETKDSTSPAGYEFALYRSNDAGEYTAADLIETRITGENGYARFSWLVDSVDVGTHYYVLKEKVPAGYVKPAADAYGWHYDTNEQLIKVVVSVDNNGVVSVQIDDQAVNTAEYTFTNAYKAARATVSLNGIATKTLNGRDLAAGEFKFLLKDSQGSVLAEGKNTAAAQDGAAAPITFFKPGTTEEYVLTYEKVGTHHYTISEIDEDLGGIDYTTRIFDMIVEVTDDGNGALHANYFFEDSTTQTVNFVNTYSVKTPTGIELEATKQLTGDRPMLSSEFHFNMFEMTDDTFETKKSDDPVATASNIGAAPNAEGVAESVFRFSTINFTEPGVHYYLVSEAPVSSDWGVKYDKTEYKVTVTVTDNLDGTITAVADKTADQLVFTNEYTPAPIPYDFAADKVLTGRTLNEGEFSFGLFAATVTETNGEQTWTAGTQIGKDVTNEENGDIVFPQLIFTQKGVYHYIAKEISGELGGVAYDDTEFYITVTVTDNNRGTLSAQAVITDDEGNLSQIVFQNEYSTEDTNAVIEATKTLTGRDMSEGEFSFVIKEGDTVVARGYNRAAAAGKAAEIIFGAIRYTLEDVGEHTYTVEEIIPEGNKKGVTYDTTKYTVKVEVSDNGDGTLKAELSDESEDVKIAFSNTYAAAETSVELKGTKKLNGATLADKQFTFELYQADEKFAAQGNAVQAVKNAADGAVAFEKVKFDKAGTYRYLVVEKNDAQADYTYDNTAWCVTVEVTDNGEGALVAKTTVNKKGSEQSASAFAFENSYVKIETPDTGDDANITLWFALLALSCAGFVTMILSKNSGKRKENA